MPSLYFFQIWPMLKFGEIHSKDQLEWHSWVFSLPLLFIWRKKNNYVDTFWSFNKVQGLGLRYVPRTTIRKPSLSNSDFSAPIGEISLICYFTLILKGMSVSMIFLWRVWFDPRVEFQWSLFPTAPQINLIKLLLANAVYLTWISWRICFSCLHFKFFEKLCFPSIILYFYLSLIRLITIRSWGFCSLWLPHLPHTRKVASSSLAGTKIISFNYVLSSKSTLVLYPIKQIKIALHFYFLRDLSLFRCH